MKPEFEAKLQKAFTDGERNRIYEEIATLLGLTIRDAVLYLDEVTMRDDYLDHKGLTDDYNQWTETETAVQAD